MQEVTRQLGPLAERVGVISNNFERLFNTNGGPKGFLQTEGQKTDDRFKMVFNILEEHKRDLEPLKKALNEHLIREEQREEFQNKRDEEIKEDLKLKHQENTDKLSEVSAQISKKTLIWNVAGVFVGITAVLVAVLSVWMMVKLSKVGDLNHLFVGAHQPIYTVSNRPQVSTIPSMR